MSTELLLVEDDPDDALLFSDAVKELHFDVNLQHFENGSSALNYLMNPLNPIPNIVFLDLNMPSMSGWECLREIKKIMRLNVIPVIMYSTANLSLQGIDPNDVGAAAFYQKSDNFDALKKTLNTVLTGHLKNI